MKLLPLLLALAISVSAASRADTFSQIPVGEDLQNTKEYNVQPDAKKTPKTSDTPDQVWSPARRERSEDIFPLGCVPSSTLFAQLYADKYSAESATIIILKAENDDGSPIAHAVAVVSYKGKIWAWDQEVGYIATKLTLDAYTPAKAAKAIQPLYDAAVRGLKHDVASGFSPSPTSAKLGDAAWTKRLAELLPAKCRARTFETTSGKHAIGYVFADQYVVYVPSIGGAMTRIDGKMSLADLTRECLRKLSVN